MSIRVGKDRFFNNYYQSFIDLLNPSLPGVGNSTLHQRRFRTRYIDEADLTIGLDEAVFQIRDNPDALIGYFSASSRQQTLLQEREIKVGLDGVMVNLGSSWNQNQMYLEPSERKRV